MATLGDVRTVFINLKKEETVTLVSKKEKQDMILTPVENGIQVKEGDKEVVLPVKNLEVFLKTHRLDWLIKKETEV